MYILTIFLIFLFFFTQKLEATISQVSFSHVWSTFDSYIYGGVTIKVLLLQLSGLPPFFFFFIKLTILLNSIFSVDFFMFFLIFLNMLLSMFFYLRVFTTTNSVFDNSFLKKLCSRTVFFNKTKIYCNRIFSYYLSFYVFIFFNFVALVTYLNILSILGYL